ncbi:MAG: glucosamine-6-phosphate deaminase [Aristaeellaceae bacterium]
MQICVFDTPVQVGQAAATLIAAQIIHKPDSVLGLATGSSPIPTYQHLIALYRQGVLDFSRVTTFNLDEYVGIPEEHECSYHRFMNEQLFDHVNVRREAVHVPNGNAQDMAHEAAAYDMAIRAAGGIDLQLLGIGHNGHIGFNEPGDAFIYGCHVVQLSRSTIEANKRFFASEADVPRRAISLGIGSIMNARQVLLIATGADKADAVRRAIQSDLDPEMQASILRTHPDVIFMLDKAAASLL